MTFKNETVKRVIARVLAETCDKPDFVSVKFHEITPTEYHIQYHENDPYEGLDFKIKVTELPYNDSIIYHIHIYDSVYADDGDFFLDYHLVED